VFGVGWLHGVGGAGKQVLEQVCLRVVCCAWGNPNP
jgi:hypothetical protein